MASKGGLQEAANRLDVSQSTGASARTQRLEPYSGTPLFVRKRSGMNLAQQSLHFFCVMPNRYY
ncbi:LysR family transcriptional regulator [Methylomicrobium sp. Wu6]|uniref:helix-turn-helix domain-containing protein n=1 Tax=Methylomicrobium sp. Wu6 TaxID=3107928 RepID=UPI002DD69ADD|nr:LysR family transcriptional regulator [Methylomicrobium sp. Wu6]MEC4748466.1 LysR family transcriptional regulator [Methylomicrobium sp. Wu6]